MTIKTLIIITFPIIMLSAGCGGPTSTSLKEPIEQIEQAIDKVEKNKGKMTKADWKTLEEEIAIPLKTLSEALKSNEVSTTDKLKVAKLISKWSIVLAQTGIHELKQEADTTFKKLGGEFDKVVQEYKSTTSDSIE